MAAASEYVLEPIRDRAEFTLYRGRQRGNPMPLLVVAPTEEQPLPQSLRRLEHEYSLAAELEPAWAAKPLALTDHEGRTVLVLADPGGEPLDRIIERDREQLEHQRRFTASADEAPRCRAKWKSWYGGHGKCCRSAPTQALRLKIGLDNGVSQSLPRLPC
jgi:hypothetical protein